MKKRKKQSAIYRANYRAKKLFADKGTADIPGVVIIGSNAQFGICDLCGAENEELRPYGPKGENICFACGMKDIETTDKNIVKFLGGNQ